MTFAAFYPVDGPPPEAPSYGILDTARIVPEGNEYWMNGVEVWTYPSDLPGTHDPCATGSQVTQKSAGTGLSAQQDFGAFTVYSPETCTSRVMSQIDEEFKRRATVQLAATESWAVGRELEQGLRVPANAFLAKTGAIQATGDDLAKTPRVGLAFLERAIANTGRAGMIHATVEIATAWASTGQVFHDDDTSMLHTRAKHTPVCVDSGYQGVAPATRTPSTATVMCAYATGPIDIRRSPVFVVPDKLSEALDRSSNTVVYRAERNYVYDWDANLLRAYARIDWTT